MALVYILSVVFFVGSTSAFHFDYSIEASNSTLNSTLLKYPSIVQIESLLPTGIWQYSCSASILNSRYVLTAASCVSGPTYQPYLRRIRAGANNRGTGGVFVYVEKEFNYLQGNVTNHNTHDISVVRTASAFVYSDVIKTTSIPQANSFIPNGITLVQLGWGRGNFSNSLSESSVVTVSGASCGNQTTPQNSTSNILCGIVPGGFLSSNGDVGSPWFLGNVTIGVVSGTNLGNNSWTGAISASITYYTNWIVSTAV